MSLTDTWISPGIALALLMSASASDRYSSKRSRETSHVRMTAQGSAAKIRGSRALARSTAAMSLRSGVLRPHPPNFRTDRPLRDAFDTQASLSLPAPMEVETVSFGAKIT
jgi:hypothetical protein